MRSSVARRVREAQGMKPYKTVRRPGERKAQIVYLKDAIKEAKTKYITKNPPNFLPMRGRPDRIRIDKNSSRTSNFSGPGSFIREIDSFIFEEPGP